jgi:thioredoxin 1
MRCGGARLDGGENRLIEKETPEMGAAATLTTDNFDATIEDNDIVLVDFWASWCGPCRSFAPVFEQAVTEHPDIVFGKVDTEDQQELAATFNIRSIPTLMVFRDQVLLYSQPGALPKAALDDLIGQVRKLDMDAVRQQIADERASVSSN